jgi:hypothetical protein
MDEKIGEDTACYPGPKAEDNDKGVEFVFFNVSKCHN